MNTPNLDCLSCGACCFGGHDRYIALLPEDEGRPIPPEATVLIEGRRYMRMEGGHCAQLRLTPERHLSCAIYDNRPTACRAFRAGSFECSMSRKHRGHEARQMQALADLPGLPPDALPPRIGA
ncbi:MAG: YkgJ family cysteine cluster protein [Paracoccaceae bacterium]|nr:YkgJ family cysteine cluster protein [Paracoccaceae bacterium]MDE3121363.1 YkgJ family cysteine cluster protein [Paracoccaceae bacterium]MDE3238944.1 YkgJ family cysteine cluster protein [Paracoccaceae bacterium]